MPATVDAAALKGRYVALCEGAAELGTDELLDVIELAQREKDAASARQAVALAHLSARETHLCEDGTTVEVHHGLGHQRLDAPELAAPRIGCSVHVASNRVLTAIRQLTRTPAVVEAMASGDLDEHRAAAVTEETEFLGDESAAEVVDRVKEHWAELTMGPLRRFVARTAAQVDPDAVTKDAEDERERRGLTRRTGTRGTDHWRGDFTVERARGAWAAVTERARQLVRDGHAETLQHARADAMMELILEHSDVKVVVHTTRAAEVPADEKSRPSGDGDLVEVGGLGAPGTTFVPCDWLDRADTTAEHVGAATRDLTCDPHTGALLSGKVPDALASGRTTRGRAAEGLTEKYRIPAAMARLVRLRDGSCRFPGCSIPARQCDLDHVRAWPAGPTAPHNLIALCRRHHRIKQRPGWRVRIHPDATVTWTDPTGHQVSNRPVDHVHLVTSHASHDIRGAATDLTRPAGPPDALRMRTRPSTFEEDLHAWLADDLRHPVRVRPHVWAADGTLRSGPPRRTDLETAAGPLALRGPGITVVLDLPPPPPPAPDVIPF